MENINFKNKKISKLGINISKIIDSGDDFVINEVLKLSKENDINFFCYNENQKQTLDELLLKYNIENFYSQSFNKNFIEVNYFIWDENLKHNLVDLKEREGFVIAENIEADGKLFKLEEYDEKLFKKLRPWESTISWAVRWAMKIKEVDIIMCNVDSISYLKDLIHIFNMPLPLDNSEWNYLVDLGKKIKDE